MFWGKTKVKFPPITVPPTIVTGSTVPMVQSMENLNDFGYTGFLVYPNRNPASPVNVTIGPNTTQMNTILNGNIQVQSSSRKVVTDTVWDRPSWTFTIPVPEIVKTFNRNIPIEVSFEFSIGSQQPMTRQGQPPQWLLDVDVGTFLGAIGTKYTQSLNWNNYVKSMVFKVVGLLLPGNLGHITMSMSTSVIDKIASYDYLDSNFHGNVTYSQAKFNLSYSPSFKEEDELTESDSDWEDVSQNEV